MSRETRRLLITIVVSLGALWLLARIRFQDRAVTAVPVSPVLAQLRPQSTYDDLARSLSQIRPTLAAAMSTDDSRVAALRVGPEAGVAISGSTLSLVPLRHGDVPSIDLWNPRVVDYPRYLVAVDVFDDGISPRPVFVGTLSPIESPFWSGSIWRLPPNVNLPPGTFVFTTDGLLAGVSVEDAALPALVPASVLMEAAARLLEKPRVVSGYLGVLVQSTLLGLAIAWVDPTGPAAGSVAPADIIDAVDGRSIHTVDHWRARTERITSGEVVTLRVRTDGAVRDVQITATPDVEPPADPALGLRLQTVPQVGAEVLDVQPRSRSDRAGIRRGDVITAIGAQKAPRAGQIAQRFEGASEQEKILVAITRGREYHVVVLEK